MEFQRGEMAESVRCGEASAWVVGAVLMICIAGSVSRGGGGRVWKCGRAELFLDSPVENEVCQCGH